MKYYKVDVISPVQITVGKTLEIIRIKMGSLLSALINRLKPRGYKEGNLGRCT